ncbi:shikimate dehydrogenase [Ammoniphilus sp. YIM 78166]|uniref:shikimate dehydrogenase n=1 Tax=Ammoniphilus sp. YIM 78166 TaxID=1644106 RepID=UPI0010705771|nr:shikimate dehydrogenase [Ammoniphilus sp. YIM 78166]
MNNQTVMTGLFGNPVAQSMSPAMQNAAFQKLGLNFAYAAFPVANENLQDAVNGIKALGFRGVNVTIPHKVEIMAYLDEIDEEAKDIGAVNTIVNDGGKLIGYNTDGAGYVRSLLQETSFRLEGKRVLVIGAGGAARAVSISLARHGVKQIMIANRSVDKAKMLADRAARYTEAKAIDLDNLDSNTLSNTDLLINTTSVGMYPQVDDLPIPREYLHSGLLVSDLIYNPMKTRILKEAAQAGASTHEGLGMFIHQGALAFKLWTGNEAPIDVMRNVVLEKLRG